MESRYSGLKQLAVLLAAVISLLSLGFVSDNVEEQPVVHVVLFYSTKCGHCHYVMTEILPPLQEYYGSQLDIQMIELASQQDVDLLYSIAAAAGLGINQVGVPLMVVGDHVLIGSAKIPDELPGMIEMGLSGGGIDFPDIPGLRERIDRLSISPQPEVAPTPTPAPIAVVEALYFFTNECPLCKAVDEDILQPLESQYAEKFNIQRLDVGIAQNYELLSTAEGKYGIQAEERGLPTLILGGKILEGEVSIREKITSLLDQGFRTGISFPDLPGLEEVLQQNSLASDIAAGDPTLACESEDADVCASDLPIWAAYFYQPGCQSCNRIEADIAYIQSKYPQLSVEKFNVDDYADLASWMAGRIGRNTFLPPALFIGEGGLIGENEITPDAIDTLVSQYQWTGAEKSWQNFNLPISQNEAANDFIASGPLKAALSGILDGLNPAAFTTLILLASYLALSGRKNRQFLIVGGAYILGISAACTAVSLGIFQLLQLPVDRITVISQWVYGSMAVFCVILAAVIYSRYFKARYGKTGEMNLSLPRSLRSRVNEAAGLDRKLYWIMAGSFAAGILVCFIEFAFSRQINPQAITFFSNNVNSQVKEAGLLFLYILFFITPQAVVLLLFYYGSSSDGIRKFLQNNTGRLELGMSVMFVSLGAWLLISIL
jgi:thiol-disulfide isomerase/thioredoxin